MHGRARVHAGLSEQVARAPDLLVRRPGYCN
jgi:hypothetical protein